MQKVLITGGAGFIGSHITEELITEDFEIIVIDNLTFGKTSNLIKNEKITLYESDILSDDLDKIFYEHKIDFCIHLAAQTNVATAMKNPMVDAKTNILGSINILRLCKEHNVKKIIAASSAAVYGTPESLPLAENHSTQPLSFYGLSKLAMEKYFQSYGLDYIIFRFANVYGPRQNNLGEAGVVSIFYKLIKNNLLVNIEDDGEQTRDFVYVKDIAKACLWALQTTTKNEIINVSTGEGISINTLVDKMSAIYGYNKLPNYLPKRIGDIKHSVLNNNKYQSLSNFRNFTNIETGLHELYTYRGNN